jgi:hypothetical protein
LNYNKNTITFTPSNSPNVAGYRLYIEQAPNPVTYNSDVYDIGDKTTIDLTTIEGIPRNDGIYNIGVVSLDDLGNESSMSKFHNIPLDFLQPAPPISNFTNNELVHLSGRLESIHTMLDVLSSQVKALSNELKKATGLGMRLQGAADARRRACRRTILYFNCPGTKQMRCPVNAYKITNLQNVVHTAAHA